MGRIAFSAISAVLSLRSLRSKALKTFHWNGLDENLCTFRTVKEPVLSLFLNAISSDDELMRRAVTFLALVLSGCTTSFAHTRKTVRHPVDSLYGSALAAANRFLRAWQDEDQETGIMMLSDTARKDISPDKLQSFFSPGPDAAYEIARGKRVNSVAYEFPVVLFDFSNTRSHTRVCTVIVTRSGRNEWAIDKLP